MNPVAADWAAKAEGDWETAVSEHASGRPSGFDAACYHAQQCAEKWLKAALIAHALPAPKVHDRLVLAQLLAPSLPGWSFAAADLDLLTFAATAYRYPGRTASMQDAEAALAACRRLRDSLRPHLPQTPTPSTPTP